MINRIIHKYFLLFLSCSMLATGHLQAITVGFTNSSGTFSEAAGYGDFTLTLSDACGGCLIAVQFSGTATASNGGNNATGGDDYDHLYNRAGLTQDENSEQEQGQSANGTGSVVIYTYGLGTTLTVSLDIENDTRYEGGASATDEYVTFMVYVVSGATVSGNQFYQFNIEDDDAVPVLSFTTETSVMDEYGDDTESFEYIRIEPSGVADVSTGSSASNHPSACACPVDGSRAPPKPPLTFDRSVYPADASICAACDDRPPT